MITWDPPYPREPEWDADGNVIGATDWLGNVFKVGDQVTYCIGAGRGQMMAIGRVLKLKNEVKQRMEFREPKKGETPNYKGPYTGLDYVRYRVLYDCITVQVLTLKTSGPSAKRTKPAWVNPMNITALPMTGVSE